MLLVDKFILLQNTIHRKERMERNYSRFRSLTLLLILFDKLMRWFILLQKKIPPKKRAKKHSFAHIYRSLISLTLLVDKFILLQKMAHRKTRNERERRHNVLILSSVDIAPTKRSPRLRSYSANSMPQKNKIFSLWESGSARLKLHGAINSWPEYRCPRFMGDGMLPLHFNSFICFSPPSWRVKRRFRHAAKS